MGICGKVIYNDLFYKLIKIKCKNNFIPSGKEILMHIWRLKGTRDNFKIHVNFMKPTFLFSLRQDKAYDKK